MEHLYVLSALVGRAKEIRVFPHEVVQVFNDKCELVDSFVHGVSDKNSLSGAFLCRDKRISKGLVQYSKVASTVKGASFSYRSSRSALEYAKKLNPPIVLRDQEESAFEDGVVLLKDHSQLKRALSNHRKLSQKQRDYVLGLRPGYSRRGLTLLPQDEIDANPESYRKKASFRFLLEERPEGELYRFFVANKKALCGVSVSLQGEGAPSAFIRDVPSDEANVAVSSLSAVPGVFSGSVDLIKVNKADGSFSKYKVIEVSERFKLGATFGSDEGEFGWMAREVVEAFIYEAYGAGELLEKPGPKFPCKIKVFPVAGADGEAKKVEKAFHSYGLLLGGADSKVNESFMEFEVCSAPSVFKFSQAINGILNEPSGSYGALAKCICISM